MANTYEYDNQLIKGLEKYYPNVVSRLNYPGDAETIKKIEEEIKEELPESFKKLYQQFDGEGRKLYVGVILGFSLLSAKDVLKEIRFFQETVGDRIIDSMSKDVISEEQLKKRILVPFAFDNDSCYIALDLTPGRKGKKGQIITLDLEYENSFFLADSIENFYDFILRMMEEKKCQIAIGDYNEEYFEFESGHFFNHIEKILADI